MITGGYDFDFCVKFPEILEADEAGITVCAECAHLFSESAQDDNKVSFLLCFLGSVSNFQQAFGICWHCIYDAQDVRPRA